MPIYESLGEVSIRYIIEHSESECIFSAAKNLIALARALRPLKGNVRVVIYWGECNQRAVEVRRTSMIGPRSLLVIIAPVVLVLKVYRKNNAFFHSIYIPLATAFSYF